MPWQVELHEDFLPEFLAFPEPVQDALAAALIVVGVVGPSLGRPMVDTLKGSKVSNLKELRFNAADGVWRALFAFNGRRVAVVAVAGDKKGANQARFYKALIAKAEERLKG